MSTAATAHSKYNINYHLVFCPKYRHSVLKGQVETYFRRLLENICNHYNYQILALEVMPDHVHLFVSMA